MHSYPKSRVYLYSVLALVTLAIDLGSKEIAFRQLGLYQHSEWILTGWLKFRIQTNLNHGALWGMGRASHPCSLCLVSLQSPVSFTGCSSEVLLPAPG